MKFCQNCGKEIIDNTVVCPDCGTEQNNVLVPLEQKMKSKKRLWITLVSVVVVLTGVTVAGFLSNWFGLISPFDEVLTALKNTLEAESVTLKYEVTTQNSSGKEVDNEDGKVRFMIDKENEELTLILEDDNSTELFYDEKRYYFNDTWATSSNVDTDEIFEIYNKVITKEGIDWDELIDEMYLDKFIDSDNIDVFIEALYKNYFSNEDWLKKNLGFEEKSGVYSFKPDFDSLYDDILKLAEEHDVLKKDMLNEIDDNEDQIMKFIDTIDAKCSITLDGKYISKIEVTLEIDNDTLKLNIDISDINSTEISQEEIDKIIEDVETAIEKDTCSDCNERLWGDDYCGNCNDLCYDCKSRNDKEDMTYYLGEYYCNNCIGECDFCGYKTLLDYLYYYEGYHFCSDCYYQ